MSESLDSNETVELENLTVANRLCNTVYTLKNRNFPKYSNVGDRRLQDLDLQNVCVDVSIIESLKKVTYSAETFNNESDVSQIVLHVLSKNIEDIENDIYDTKLLINEENAAINRMEDVTKKLDRFKEHNNESHQVYKIAREVSSKFKKFKKYLNELISTLYPNKEDEIKTILMDSVSVSPDNSDIYPYIEINEEYDANALELLITANLIQIHPENEAYFKLFGIS